MTSKRPKSKPLFVAISDIHFNLNNLELCSQALLSALVQAEELNIPLVIAGDLHDTKAIIRAEVANAIQEILRPSSVQVIVIVGNHDLVNEKGSEHGLNYLSPYADVIDQALRYDEIGPGVVFIPYQNSADNFAAVLKQKAQKGNIVVCHQGVKGALMGDYVQDKSAIDVKILKDFPTISGHYHKHQTIGTLTYIGNPFTMSFGEANDGPKGFLIVNDDGTFDRKILDLRKHVIIETDVDTLEEADLAGADPFAIPHPADIVWLKVKGPASILDTLKKKNLAALVGHSNFKLDKIATASTELEANAEPLTDQETLDALIDQLGEVTERKQNLKALWRELLS